MDEEKARLYDPRGVIRESYRMPGLDAGECRSIFLDWLLAAAPTPPLAEQAGALLAAYGAQAPDHPMSAVLRAAVQGEAAQPGRRGGWRGRRRPDGGRNGGGATG